MVIKLVLFNHIISYMLCIECYVLLCATVNVKNSSDLLHSRFWII